MVEMLQSKESKHVNLTVSKEVHQALRQAAFDKEITMTQYVRDALEEKLKQDNYIRR